MKITSDRFTFMHHRGHEPCDATFAFLASDVGITFGWALVSEKDNFNRAKGRLIASNRLVRSGLVIPADFKFGRLKILEPFNNPGEYNGFFVDRADLTAAAFRFLHEVRRLPRVAARRWLNAEAAAAFDDALPHPTQLERDYRDSPYR